MICSSKAPWAKGGVFLFSSLWCIFISYWGHEPEAGEDVDFWCKFCVLHYCRLCMLSWWSHLDWDLFTSPNMRYVKGRDGCELAGCLEMLFLSWGRGQLEDPLPVVGCLGMRKQSFTGYSRDSAPSSRDCCYPNVKGMQQESGTNKREEITNWTALRENTESRITSGFAHKRQRCFESTEAKGRF